MFKGHTEEDKRLFELLPHIELSSDNIINSLVADRSIPAYSVVSPTEEYGFLHESAIIEYHGIIFTSWYNCVKHELQGVTPIRFSQSFDNGKTWSEPLTVTKDLHSGILYCPPVFGICDDKLYMLLNQMVSADHIHSLDLYIYNEAENEFRILWSRPIPFKLNTNVVALENGKLMLPGRIAEQDGFPNTPAVLISDSGKIDAEWRLVYIQKNGTLPDGSELVHPEISAIVDGARIYMFSRNDKRSIPLIYISEDNGESWSEPYSHDIPFSASKIYSGTLSNKRNYVIANMQPDRQNLAIFFSEAGSMKFTKGYLIQSGYSESLGHGTSWHYPCACESNGKLYIAYTTNYETFIKRGLTLSVIDI